MKNSIRILGLILFCAVIVTSVNPSECSARRRQKYQKGLTDNPRLKEADRDYRKAVRFLERGDGAFRKRPGEAVQFYSNAESYLNDAIFKLKELGDKYHINVFSEVDFCKRLRRGTHVKKGKASKEAKHR